MKGLFNNEVEKNIRQLKKMIAIEQFTSPNPIVEALDNERYEIVVDEQCNCEFKWGVYKLRNGDYYKISIEYEPFDDCWFDKVLCVDGREVGRRRDLSEEFAEKYRLKTYFHKVWVTEEGQRWYIPKEMLTELYPNIWEKMEVTENRELHFKKFKEAFIKFLEGVINDGYILGSDGYIHREPSTEYKPITPEEKFEMHIKEWRG